MPAKAYREAINLPRPAYLGGGTWMLSNLKAYTVLFGRNGSGKSLMLRAVRDAYIEECHYVAPERPGSLEFNPNYLPHQASPQQRQQQSNANSHQNYREQIIARVQTFLAVRGATRDGVLPESIDAMESLLSKLLPDFELKITGENTGYTLQRVGSEVRVTNINQLSSGEGELITLGLDILTIAAIWKIKGQSTRILLLDEPDAHIHPDLQSRFADFLRDVATRYDLQVIVATHSTTLLAALGQFVGTQCGVLYMNRSASTYIATEFTETLQQLSACLGGHLLMGPLFGVPLLLVEGDDDYRIWSQVPRHHVINFAVLPCRGEDIFNFQSSLEKVFGAIREPMDVPAGYALLDGDKALPSPSPKNPQAHVRFIRLNCHEAENLYFTDEVLALLKTNWNDAAAAIAAASPRHGSKAARLAAAPTWDRQRDDLKELIQEGSLAIDPKHVHWTQRVGAAIGARRPTGQLSLYLGNNVLSALWGK